MASDLSNKDFARRRLGTTCRLLKNLEDIAAKYAHIEDDDIIDLTDLTIHKDKGQLSRSYAKEFGYSNIKFTKKTLPDHLVEREWGDCLEEEFPGNFGDENDGYETKSVAALSMISTKTVMEGISQKIWGGLNKRISESMMMGNQSVQQCHETTEYRGATKT